MVIGGGHNGLVCAAYLARSGRRVLVLEAASQVGGAAVTREFAPGFRVSACAHLLHLMPPSIVRELSLDRQGLELAATDLPTTALDPEGEHLSLSLATDAVRALRSRCAADAAAYEEWQSLVARIAAALHPVLNITPPRLGTEDWRDRMALLGVGWRLRRLGRRDLRELLRIGGMCVHDLLEDRFRLPLLKGALALDAVLGTNYGPRSPGTVLSLLYRAAAAHGGGSFVQPAGGLGSLSEALARAAVAAGAEVRTGSIVERILVSDDRAAGVRLASGETISAATVISSADPKTTFLRLLGCEHLDAGFVRRVTQLRSRGLTAKLHLALARLPEFPGLDAAALGGRLLIAPSADYIERAYNYAKYDEFSSAPVLEVTLPTLADAALAPEGRHVLSAIVQYAPYTLAGGWSAQRQRFTELLIDTLARYSPDLRECVTASELLAPPDIEREFRISGGHWHHAELALDQFFMLRPVPGATQYRAPLAGLFLCGAGCHPGGGVMGLAGRNAAQALIREAA
ncbi:MAG: NAD(P)/FAD-dependent oxidoreductase [Gammaproteobacteria bacterium]|nr:NAD(P)/FAD-dependent oxidoreductase [Gammaproteobacteria bacterium]